MTDCGVKDIIEAYRLLLYDTDKPMHRRKGRKEEMEKRGKGRK